MRRSTKRSRKLSTSLRPALALFIVFTFIAFGTRWRVAAFIVPDDGATGVSSTINISGLGPVTSVAVKLTINSMPKPDNIDMLLVGPNGISNLVFMSDAGGDETILSYPFSGTITLSDSGTDPVSDDDELIPGTTYKPGDYGGTESGMEFGLGAFVLNHAATEGSSTFASAFTGIDSTGTWTLYVRDDEGPDFGVTDISSWSLIINGATAADAVIGGHITAENGKALSGTTVNLSGTQSRKTITDASGNYRFDQVESNGFYTVTPSRLAYNFSPASRSFSQLGEKTEAVFSAASTGEQLNPLDTAEYFVRQQYVDLLGREPEELGFNYWSDRVLECGADQACIDSRRRDVAAAFFIEAEFQQTGSFIYRLYKGALGRNPGYREFSLDRQQVVGGANLETAKQRFTETFVQTSEFLDRYQEATSAESFVDALLRNVQRASAVDLSGERTDLISRYNRGTDLNQGRSLALRGLIENAAFIRREYNAAFVLSEYFGFLRRDPESEGYNFWLDVIDNREPGNFRGMVCAFITSAEYQLRFSNVVSHTNAECAR
jgi:carboxypeptidase family protein